ncbi:hypothetical protein H9N28_08125 [Rhodobacter capsulatus]|uniref:hypothetical protein n=1 Tax=Rhodobacter capsulatus TaxID=1061 RepID=UPI0006DBE507|nr:hypothetical protein [Rhodobacter capsulatus]KQB13211.1 hypothetical protein AP071_17225 [Rhodobacter capsulatus]KQB15703.1 hypothetical protein AP073_13710 [Rhodobacter capsulatus]PZX21330.1 hypothetical protein LY44_03449 [Rhodobacter capsulatus]QNR64763.1 hypothetical protein H9N28_08125 [Rhodobacter capsulatus]
MTRTVDLTPVPVWVAGKGLVSPPGWISPETRALMQKAQDDCAAYQAAKLRNDEKGVSKVDTLSDTAKGTGTPAGFVIDPTGGQR